MLEMETPAWERALQGLSRQWFPCWRLCGSDELCPLLHRALQLWDLCLACGFEVETAGF